MTKNAAYLTEVRAQYEDLPYPPRDPEEEKKGLLQTRLDHLDTLNHFGFEGKQSFGEDFRVLIAGGGTGDAAIYLAEQLYGRGAEIIYLDISTASMELAKQRSKVRGLDNITFHHGSLLELPERKDLGTFDYINCSGVLHHLSDPEAGLAALISVLKDDGVLGIMIYAKTGRTAVYQMQEMLRLATRHVESHQEKLAIARDIMRQLPKTNWFFCSKELMTDWKTYGDAGIYDLFLHSQDRAYSVDEVYDYIEGQNLTLRTFLPGYRDRFFYMPETFIKDDVLLAEIKKKPLRTQQAIGELLSGGIIKHTFYASKKPFCLPSVEMEDNVPFFSASFWRKDIYKKLSEAADALKTPALRIDHNEMTTFLHLNTHTRDILRFMDGQRSTREIFNNIIQQKKQAGEKEPTRQELMEEMKVIYASFNKYDWLLLRYKPAKALPTLYDMVQRMQLHMNITG